MLLVASFLCLYRIAAGPTAPDRTVAIDILGTLIVGFVCLYAVKCRQDFYINIGLAWALLSFIGTVALFGVVGIYPNLLPSRIDPAYSMTIANSSSSQLTLTIMLCVALVFVPIVIAYQAWVYRLFKHKITEEDLAYEEAY